MRIASANYLNFGETGECDGGLVFPSKSRQRHRYARIPAELRRMIAFGPGRRINIGA
jgi:hypothetical protein